MPRPLRPSASPHFMTPRRPTPPVPLVVAPDAATPRPAPPEPAAPPRVVAPASAERAADGDGLEAAHEAHRYAWAPLAALALLVVGAHVAVSAAGPYGIHRDELLYLAMGRHLRFWAMDFPPFIAVTAETTRALFGDGLWAVRLPSALAHAALLLVAARLARELGGGRGAQLLAAACVALSPLFLRAGTLFQPVVFDQLWWTLALWALVRLGRQGAHADHLRTRAEALRDRGPVVARDDAQRAAVLATAPAPDAGREVLAVPAPRALAASRAAKGSLARRLGRSLAEVGARLRGARLRGARPRRADARRAAWRHATSDAHDPAAAALAAARHAAVHGGRRDWLLLGTALGLGLLTKFSVAFIALPIAVAVLVAAPLRRALAGPWPWAAAALACLLGAPSVVGQVALGWPVRGQMDDLRASQLAHVGPADFLVGQAEMLGPAVLVAALGLWALLAAPAFRRARPAGLAALGALLLLLAGRGKAYYAGPIYPLLWAAGAAALARGLSRAVPAAVARWPLAVRLGVPAALVIAFGALTLPFGLPILPPAAMARHAAGFGGTGTRTNDGGQLPLPQDYADMLGWPQLAAAAGRAWAALPPERRVEAAVLAANYGQAGALDFYGPRVGLPAPVSPAGSWWFFGPGPRAGSPLLVVGVPHAELRRFCRVVLPLPPVHHALTRWQVDEERDVPMAWCESPFRTLQQLWPSLAGRN